MSGFGRFLKRIGRALRRFFMAVGRFFKFLGKKLACDSRVSKQIKEIAKKEKTIESIYTEIGRNYYEAHAGAPEELLSDLCGAVNGHLSEIEEARVQIEEVRTAYDKARAEAREKAKARRDADKTAAREEKEAAIAAQEEREAAKAAAAELGEAGEEEPVPAVFQQPDTAPVIEVPAAPAQHMESTPPAETTESVEPDAPAESEPPAEAEVSQEPEGTVGLEFPEFDPEIVE